MSNQSSTSKDKRQIIQDVIQKIEQKSAGGVISIAVNANYIKTLHTIEKFLQIFGENTVLK